MFTSKIILFGLTSILTCGVSVYDTRDLIEQALDEPTSIQLENVRLDEAIGIVSAQTGVRLVMPQDVMNLAPHGGETVLQRVDISGMPLRAGLAKLLSPLAMDFVVQDDHVEIVATPALRCLGRSPTWSELELINKLATQSLDGDESTLDRLRERVQFRVPAPDPWPLLASALKGVGSGSVSEALTIASGNLGWAWCVDGDRVVIETVSEQYRRYLERPISLRLNNRPLVEVLSAVGRASGVDVRSEPGTLASLPDSVQRNFSLNVTRQSAEDALEQIAAFTGLGYLIDADGVLFYRADRALEGPTSTERGGGEDVRPAPTAGDPYVGKVVITLDSGTTMEWLVRRSELPPDLRQRREDDLRRAFERLRNMP
ncbi:MAG: hypothetical protein J5J06_14315 [Phycisphaerae bacterium]|nr:hypothetical protein [Phycisphaerae bacterium]